MSTWDNKQLVTDVWLFCYIKSTNITRYKVYHLVEVTLRPYLFSTRYTNGGKAIYIHILQVTYIHHTTRYLTIHKFHIHKWHRHSIHPHIITPHLIHLRICGFLTTLRNQSAFPFCGFFFSNISNLVQIKTPTDHSTTWWSSSELAPYHQNISTNL